MSFTSAPIPSEGPLAWHEQFKVQSIWMPVLFCCVETPVLYNEVELVGAAIAVDMVNRERFIAVNSELPHERRDDLVVAMLHERWIVFLIWGDENRMTGSLLSSRNICNTFGLQ